LMILHCKVDWCWSLIPLWRFEEVLQERFLSSWRLESLSFAFVSWSVISLGLRLQGEGNWPI
jgi:hypothetical protein